MKDPIQYRHGDVLLVMIDALPKLVEFIEVGNKVLAEGEATNHFHRLIMDTNARVIVDPPNENMYVTVPRGVPAILTHEEHGDIELGKGVYKVIRQTEYTPQGVRQVSD